MTLSFGHSRCVTHADKKDNSEVEVESLKNEDKLKMEIPKIEETEEELEMNLISVEESSTKKKSRSKKKTHFVETKKLEPTIIDPPEEVTNSCCGNRIFHEEEPTDAEKLEYFDDYCNNNMDAINKWWEEFSASKKEKKELQSYAGEVILERGKGRIMKK